jgi:SAM-dependent methyltransferase/uncharacterized protein YbaR (Trm112 family)
MYDLLCCPRCKGTLDHYAERYECIACSAVYPIVIGIPDFRVYPDPYISLEDDREKGQRLAGQATALNLDFRELVRFYYSITPEVPPDLAQYYENHHVAGVKRGEGIIERLHNYRLDGAISSEGLALDMGCGTGGFVAAAWAMGRQVIGIDIAFRWIVVGRHRMKKMGFDPSNMICACADYLPFRDGALDLIIAENLIEHTNNAGAVLAEANRVRRSCGTLLARTVNRFAIGPEPHVGVWGVGFLPRRWMDRYVRKVKGIPYQHIHLQSYFELQRLLPDSDLHVTYPRLLEADFQHQPPSRQRLFRTYARVAEIVPPLRFALTVFGPYLDIVSVVGPPVSQN